ncbi:hypothetical protein GQR58_012200 [Nymphon striatum]|nr:hypothetical protein GQR58_012200 [Nymphon striatum]
MIHYQGPELPAVGRFDLNPLIHHRFTIGLGLKSLRAGPSILMRINIGTVHQSQADTPFLSGYLSRIFMSANSSLDRFVAMATNNAFALLFLWKHLKLEGDEKVSRYAEEHDKLITRGEEFIVSKIFMTIFNVSCCATIKVDLKSWHCTVLNHHAGLCSIVSHNVSN